MLCSVPWHSALSPDAQLCPLVLFSVPWRPALSPGTLLCPLALCSVPWLSTWPPGEFRGKLGQVPEEGLGVRDSLVNSMPPQIAKQQQQLIQQQHKINLLQQQIQVLMGGLWAEGGTGPRVALARGATGKGVWGNPSSRALSLMKRPYFLLQFPLILLSCF